MNKFQTFTSKYGKCIVWLCALSWMHNGSLKIWTNVSKYMSRVLTLHTNPLWMRHRASRLFSRDKMSSDLLLQSYPWIDERFLEAILSRETSSHVTINRFELQPAIAEGENFSSQLIRAVIDYEYGDENDDRLSRSQSMIIKASLGEKMVRSRDVFTKEMEIYSKIIPTIERLFRDYSLDVHFGPKYWILRWFSIYSQVIIFILNRYHGGSADSHLILADLIADSYKNVRRQTGLNYEELKRCLKLLSKWHAGSVKLMHANVWIQRVSTHEIELKRCFLHTERDPGAALRFIHAASC